MKPKDFLDYLCGMGFATRKEIAVKVPGPVYQNQRSFQQKDTTFYATDIKYTIRIPKTVLDATRIEPNIQENNAIIQLSIRRRLIVNLENFLAGIRDFCAGKYSAPNHSGGGIYFTGGLGLDPIKDRGKYIDSQQVNIEQLLALGACYTQGPFDNDLHLAMLLNLLKDIMALSEDIKKGAIQTVSTEKNPSDTTKQTRQNTDTIRMPLNKPKEDILRIDSVSQNKQDSLNAEYDYIIATVPWTYVNHETKDTNDLYLPGDTMMYRRKDESTFKPYIFPREDSVDVVRKYKP